MSNKYLVRSVLFFPAHNDRVVKSALSSDADALVFDIEDSVLPIENKQIARNKVIEVFAEKLSTKKHYFVRTNDIESGLILRDLNQLTLDGIDGFVFPKIKTKEDIIFLSRLLETLEIEKEIKKNKFKIVAVIETTSGLANLNEICKASERMIGVVFGCEDYIADLGGIHDSEDNSIWVARAIIANTAKANGLFALDAPHINMHDLIDLQRHIKTGRNLGFDGMPVLHPAQIEHANKYYAPSEEELKEAAIIIELNQKAIDEGKGVAIKDGRFLGPPIMEKIKKMIAKNDLIQSKK
jgi:citrate lyase subunit beta/citryl-CoA lyase